MIIKNSKTTSINVAAESKSKNEKNDSLENKLTWQDCRIAIGSITYSATTLVVDLIYYT